MVEFKENGYYVLNLVIERDLSFGFLPELPCSLLVD